MSKPQIPSNGSSGKLEAQESDPNTSIPSQSRTFDPVAALSCVRAMIYMSTLVSGHLRAPQVAQLDRHVEGCRKCKRLLLSILAEHQLAMPALGVCVAEPPPTLEHEAVRFVKGEGCPSSSMIDAVRRIKLGAYYASLTSRTSEMSSTLEALRRMQEASLRTQSLGGLGIGPYAYGAVFLSQSADEDAAHRGYVSSSPDDVDTNCLESYVGMLGEDTVPRKRRARDTKQDVS